MLPFSMGIAAKKGDFTAFDRRLSQRIGPWGRLGKRAGLLPDAPDSRDSLHDREPSFPGNDALLERDDVEAAFHDAQKLAAFEQERGIRRAAIRLVPARESLVQQYSVLAERREQGGQERPMEIVRDDDRAESFARKRPRSAFKIKSGRFDAGHRRQRCDRPGVAVDGQHATSAGGEKARVAAVPAREVQHARVGGNEVREADDPRRRRQSAMIGYGSKR
jgi:hypothetical protein